MPQKRDLFSIEIGDEYLKLAYSRPLKDSLELQAAGYVHIKGADAGAVSDEIRSFAKKNRIKGSQALNVIPSRFAITKNIEIPSTDKKEIKEIIDLQAGRHTPYSRDEIIMDYGEIGLFHERYTKIFLVILKKDIVTSRYEQIKSAGFTAAHASLSCEGLIQWLTSQPEGRDVTAPLAMIHIDADATDFIVGKNGTLIYMRSIPARAKDAFKDEEAGKRFFDEIKKSIESYHAENVDEPPQSVYVTGMVPETEKVISGLERAAGVQVSPLSYAERLKGNAVTTVLEESRATLSLLTPVAAAYTSDTAALNLIPGDVKLRRELKTRAKKTMTIAVLSMTALLIFCAVLITNTFMRSLYLKKIMMSYTDENEEAEELREISDRTGLIKMFLGKKGRALRIVTELFQAIPREIYLSSLSFKQDGSLTFTGTADSMSRVFSLVTDLENNTFFKNVKVDFTKSRIVSGKEVADFGLTLTIEGIW